MLKTILMFVMKPTILVGGQAVIEGVMMRVPGGYATAARDPEGSNISIKKKHLATSLKQCRENSTLLKP